MTKELKLKSAKGGFNGPLPTRAFILEHLAAVGEDSISAMHQAYEKALIDIALKNGRLHETSSGKITGKPYHKPSYHSFYQRIYQLTKEGLVELSGREEESSSPQFQDWDKIPVRHYYRLAGAHS